MYCVIVNILGKHVNRDINIKPYVCIVATIKAIRPGEIPEYFSLGKLIELELEASKNREE